MRRRVTAPVFAGGFAFAFAALALALALATFACGDPSVGSRDGGIGFDVGGQGPAPDKPILDPAAARIPYPVATLHGRAEAKRVIVEGGGNPIASTVLPDDTFCIDVPMKSEGSYAFFVFAQGADGQISEPAGPIEVQFDLSAAPMAGAQTCTGADPAGCPRAMEICGNGRDDNCNNLVDDNDPACATCTDDVLEPNNDTGAPRVDPMRFDNLQICPDDEDYYGVFARDRETINARVFFVHDAGNIDLHLLGTDRRTVLARSVSLDDDEVITYTATVSGEYKLRVFSDSGATNSYSLDLRVTAP